MFGLALVAALHALSFAFATLSAFVGDVAWSQRREAVVYFSIAVIVFVVAEFCSIRARYFTNSCIRSLGCSADSVRVVSIIAWAVLIDVVVAVVIELIAANLSGLVSRRFFANALAAFASYTYTVALVQIVTKATFVNDSIAVVVEPVVASFVGAVGVGSDTDSSAVTLCIRANPLVFLKVFA